MKLNETQRQLFLAISLRLASVSRDEKFKAVKKNSRKKQNLRFQISE